ncbi:MAG: histidine kinase [Acidimicrobiales bacterium]|nr:histidine kinase [Acidimicrobiales bacterium]
MTFAAALSEHPVAAEAVGEVVGSVLDRLGDGPDLAALFVAPAFAGAVDEIAAVVRATLRPTHLLGAVSTTVIGPRREAEHGPAVSLWAARVGRVHPVRIAARPVDGGVQVSGVPAVGRDVDRTLLLLGDPFTLPAEGLLTTMADDLPHLTVVGGLPAAPGGPGSTRLLLDDEVHSDGAVGVLLPESASPRTFVAQGCRPVGEPMIVTAADGNVLVELAGRPALDQMYAVGRGLEDDDDRSRFEQGPQVGIVVDETRSTFAAGDFLVRSIVGLDADRRAIALGPRVEVGTTVQFQVRDPRAAADVLGAELSARVDGPGDRGALVFACNGRGYPFFGVPDHDAELVTDLVGPAVAGLACAGELGPIGDRNHVHAHSATVLLTGD